MAEKHVLPPLKVNSPLKAGDTKSQAKSFLNSISMSHLEDMKSELLKINEKFYEKVAEINEIYQEMENIGDSDHILQTFCNIKINEKLENFHNDKALLGAKYIKKNEKKPFSRKKCRDLREILRFSMKDQIKKGFDKERYKEFAMHMEENFQKHEKLEIIEKQSKIQDIIAKERKKKLFIRDLIKYSNFKDSSPSPKKQSPQRQSPTKSSQSPLKKIRHSRESSLKSTSK